jgi:hypothetical protein
MRIHDLPKRKRETARGAHRFCIKILPLREVKCKPFPKFDRRQGDALVPLRIAPYPDLVCPTSSSLTQNNG